MKSHRVKLFIEGRLNFDQIVIVYLLHRKVNMVTNVICVQRCKLVRTLNKVDRMDSDDLLSKALSLIDSEDIDDLDEAKSILWDLVDEGSSEAEDILIEGFSAHGNMEFDCDSEMFQFSKLLSKRGDANAMLTVGLFCMEGVDGWDIDEDPRPWFEKAYENGCSEGRVRIALLDYMDGNCGDALSVFQDECGWSHLAKICLGTMYWNGDGNLPIDREKAQEIWGELPDAILNEMKYSIDDSNEIIDINEIIQNAFLEPQYS